jgi:hypothetical protein
VLLNMIDDVGFGHLRRTDPFGVGMNTGSPVSNTYKPPPFAFTGTIQEVRIEMK